MENKVPITVVILAKNEATRIEDCLRSVAWADEALVIDDESTDNTVALAEALGARVLSRKMENEGRHRNWAQQEAKNEWILNLDSDERVTPELAEEIRDILSQTPPQFESYSIPRRNFIGDQWIQHGGWYPSSQMKMFKKDKIKWEEASVHPRVISEVAWGQIKGDILHYTYRDLKDYVDKLNRHTTLEAQKWVDGGRNMKLGKALWRTVDRFFRAYIGKGGYKEGFMGFLLAALGGWYQLLSYAKYLEFKQAKVQTS